jgi:hypothetical protein
MELKSFDGRMAAFEKTKKKKESEFKLFIKTEKKNKTQ